MGRKSNVDAKLVMLKHSQAKVNLYTNYLATYLNILSRVEYITKLHIYDLMCGEGVYADNSEGSPIVALKKIKNHYFANKETCPNIELWLNDKDKSEIEKEKYKIDRVREKSKSIFRPDNVRVEFTNKDYTEIYPNVISKINVMRNSERGLIFIDPYGYKEIKPEHLKQFLQGGKIELILFLPISFMSRFAEKSLSQDEFPGGNAIEEFLSPLMSENLLEGITKPYIFINKLTVLLRNYLVKEQNFVDTFTIERDKQNVYCLFFFTHNALGFEKMLDTKWTMDTERGKGFRLDSEQESLFNEAEVVDYPTNLRDYIKSKKYVTNSDLYIYGLNNGFLPKHTNQVLKEFQKRYSNFKVYTNNNVEVRKGSFYISYKNYGRNAKQVVRILFE